MHIIGILVALAGLVFWIGRAAKGAEEIADAANTIANLPRKRRFQKTARKSGYDLVKTPVDAATVLMISTARMSDDRRVTDIAETEIVRQLHLNMQMSKDDADGLYRQMHSLTYDIVLPESALFPMVGLLKNAIDRSEAEELARMMESVAGISEPLNGQQKEFIRSFRERMNLLH